MIKINFEGVRQETPPDGDYIFVISDAEVKPSSKGTSDVIHLHLQIDSPQEYAGRNVLAWISLHPDALWSAQYFFDAVIGEPQDGELELDVSNLVGEKVGATCEQKDSPNGRKVLAPVVWWPASGMTVSSKMEPPAFYPEGEEPI